MKRWTQLLVYASVAFVLLWLARQDMLAMPNIRDWPALAGAVAFLGAGFAGSASAWRRLLQLHGLDASPAQSLASVGLTIFGKYIPGKLWVVMGRASYLADLTRQPLSVLSMVSLHAQVITLWVGLPLGSLVFIFANDGTWRNLALPTLGLWALMSAFLFSDVLGRSLNWSLQRLGRPRMSLPSLSPRLVLRAAPWFLVVWLAWCIGFALLVAALSGEPPRLADGLAFVLAATLAVLAIIAPGGLGVREGLLVLLLVMLGHPTPFATTVSVIARLWFLGGEILLFAAGLAAQHGLGRPPPRHDR
ncbi:hypothetical protein ThidrDRAFT_2634 [Thiorhodococcus drewsii AZ1]|uniref:Lysylphosphatidylglycerol synthetase/UPF0104 n=1 Tax=Thiorhodococcus drewsii AZ1 TaxID=765913 RepID=G2E2X1_9GAMM|nr:lysylphosphatidylglycerol synthase domain-containing protein [Thiorhodococcus drewsii]EGV30433.1 hypothetical protein ThidrDRAFT_2634 [Thiorhodococcus drewsii AZ1]